MQTAADGQRKGSKMIVFAAAMLGAITGWRQAASRGGARLDRIHYAAGFGIAFGILGVFVTVFIGRML